MEPTPDPLQAQLIAARRGQILDAAAKVFAEKGFHLTTIKDIAGEAGIADGTIYRYFKDKSELLIGILDRTTEAVRSETDFSALNLTDVRSFLRAYIRQPLMALKGNDFELIRILLSEIPVNAELRALFYQRILEPTVTLAEPLFQQWAEQQRIQPLDLRLTLRAISGLLLGVILERIAGDQTLQERWDELPDFLTDLILNGLGSDEERRGTTRNDEERRGTTRNDKE